jgi:hypothetical protein
MCKCTPELRTPFCGRGDCLPPASREPTESLFAVNAEQAALNWAHNYADKHQPRGSDSDADIAHLIVEQTKRIAELTIENGHLHIQLRQAEARETALRDALAKGVPCVKIPALTKDGEDFAAQYIAIDPKYWNEEADRMVVRFPDMPYREWRALSGEGSNHIVLNPEQAKIVKDLIDDVGEHGAAGMSLDYWRSPEGMALLQKVGEAVGSHAADMRKAMEEEYAARKK